LRQNAKTTALLESHLVEKTQNLGATTIELLGSVGLPCASRCRIEKTLSMVSDVTAVSLRNLAMSGWLSKSA
jgi:hypothetical protein